MFKKLLHITILAMVASACLPAQMVDYNTGLINQPGLPSSAYDFKPINFTAAITGGTYKTFSFSRCPAGVKGTNLGPALAVTNVTDNGSGLIRITVVQMTIQTGQRVTIASVGGVTAANGNWAVTRISPTTFDLVGSTFSGVYTSGGTIKQNVHAIYLSGGTGTAEAVFIGGGTCTGPTTSGTIQAYVANSHSGTYNLRSATGGIMEANWYQNPVTNSVSRKVYISSPVVTLYGPIWITSTYGLDLGGGGMENTVLARSSDYTGDLVIVDSSAAGSVLVSLHDFWLFAPYMNGSSGSAGIRIRGETCCGTNLINIKIWDEITGVFIASSDATMMQNIQYLQTRVSANQPVAGLYITGRSTLFGAASSGTTVSNSTFTVGEGYITSMPTVSGAANNGSGLVRLTTSANLYTTGDVVTVFGVTGTTEANGSWTVTVINSTTIDLQGSSFVNAYVAGGQTMFKNVLQYAMYAETADGLVVNNSSFRGEWGIYMSPLETSSGLLVTSSVVDRVRYASVAIGAQSVSAQGQITIANSWLVGNYYPSYPGIIVDMTNATEGRFGFYQNDIAGFQGDCVQLIRAKDIKLSQNTIGTCDLSGTNHGGIALLTAASGVSITDNKFKDITSLGSTTNWWMYLNADITNSLITGNNFSAPATSSFFVQAGTNSNFSVSNNIQLDSLPNTTVSTGVIAIPPTVPPLVTLSGGGTATSVTGMWPGLSLQVITGSATTFNTGGANPGDFSRNITTAAGQLVTFKMESDGKVYVQ